MDAHSLFALDGAVLVGCECDWQIKKQGPKKTKPQSPKAWGFILHYAAVLRAWNAGQYGLP